MPRLRESGKHEYESDCGLLPASADQSSFPRSEAGQVRKKKTNKKINQSLDAGGST